MKLKLPSIYYLDIKEITESYPQIFENKTTCF